MTVRKPKDKSMSRPLPKVLHPLGTCCLAFLLLIDVGALAAQDRNPTEGKRLRVIVSSDFPPFPVTNSDPDDVQSMVRFLLYANEFDIEGLITSAGTFGMVAQKKNVLAVLDEYDKDRQGTLSTAQVDRASRSGNWIFKESLHTRRLVRG